MTHLFLSNQTKAQVAAAYPDAEVIKKVCGGYAVFFNHDDYLAWSAQK